MSGLHEKLDELVTGVPVYGNLDRAVERARQEQRRRNAALAALTAAAAVIAVIVGVLAANSGRPTSVQPIAPATTPVATGSPTPTAWEPPVPLRAATSRMVTMSADSFGNALPRSDGQDTSVGEIDIRLVAGDRRIGGYGSWQFELAARAPRDPSDRTIAYGVDVDGDGDRVADCQVGIDNNGPRPGNFHVWVTNLNTHETEVQDGPPYGFPVEFFHPAEEADGNRDQIRVNFTFLQPDPGPCDKFGTVSTFYAWTRATREGKVTGRDYAPDAAWLRMDCSECPPS